MQVSNIGGISNCPGCHRDFLPNKCTQHCTNDCCRRMGCEAARKDWRKDRDVAVRCFVCWRTRDQFVAFAPCTRHCRLAFFNKSFNYALGSIGRSWQTQCHLDGYGGSIGDDGLPYHKPDRKPRIHIRYCSLFCYNHTKEGHEIRRRKGVRVRNRRWLNRNMWRRIKRVEDGVMRDRRQSAVRRDNNVMRFGDGRTDQEMFDWDTARKAAEADTDFLEIFGPLPPTA